MSRNQCAETQSKFLSSSFLRHLQQEFFRLCLAIGSHTNGLLPALIAQPTNSTYDRANQGSHSNLTAGWEQGKEAAFFFGGGQEVRIM